MIQNDLRIIERIFDFIALLFTAFICSQVISFFWVWRLYKGPPSDLEIYEHIELRIFVLITTVICYLLASKVFSNRKNSFLYVSFTGCIFSILATAVMEQFFTVTFKPLDYINLFYFNCAISLFFGDLISIFSFSIFALIKSFANWFLHKRKTLP